MNAGIKVYTYAIRELKRTRKIVKSQEFRRVVDILSTSRIWATGMGKAAKVSDKLAATLACNGRPAAYINAAEALHGDFGSIQRGDVVVAFSNSGKTDEVCQVAIKAKDTGAFLVLITGNNKTVLAKKADIVLCYGKVKEACALGLTPTTSVIVMLALADALAMEVQKRVGLTYEEYSKNHHGGYLGSVARLAQKQDQ
jgi:arabinose-5-phosphate isomerase